MSERSHSSDETGERGDELYERQIRQVVETPENIGRLVSIDVETGDYEVGDDLLQTTDRLRERHPDARVWIKRIGYDAVYAIGGTLTRTAR